MGPPISHNLVPVVDAPRSGVTSAQFLEVVQGGPGGVVIEKTAKIVNSRDVARVVNAKGLEVAPKAA